MSALSQSLVPLALRLPQPFSELLDLVCVRSCLGVKTAATRAAQPLALLFEFSDTCSLVLY